MKNLFDSLVRTFVPIIVGAVLGFFVTRGIELDPEFEAALIVALTAGFNGVYYLLVRLFETYVSPKFGWLLGLVCRQGWHHPGLDELLGVFGARGHRDVRDDRARQIGHVGGRISSPTGGLFVLRITGLGQRPVPA